LGGGALRGKLNAESRKKKEGDYDEALCLGKAEVHGAKVGRAVGG
jgi:hypothetical protein